MTHSKLCILFAFVALCIIPLLSAQPHHRRNDLNTQLNIVVIRHGDRTPIVRFPNDNVYWNCSGAPAELSQSPIQLTQGGPASTIRYAKKFVEGVLVGTCMLGQLTTKGMQQHIELGKRYGSRYGSSLKCDSIRLETTDRPRTIQSMESFMTGFLNNSPQCASSNPILSVSTVENSIHDMFTNFDACPVLSQMLKGFSKDDEWIREHEKVSDLYSHLKKVFDIPQSYNPEWYMFADIFSCRISHGVPLPPTITNDDVDRTFKMYIWEYQYANKHQKYLTLGIGSFLQRLVERMESVDPKQNNSQAGFELYSGHDTTVAPLLGTLGVGLTLDTWPEYAANLHFIISTNGTDRFVSVEYMEKPIKLNGCNSYDCTWSEFKDIVSKYTISHEDWFNQCNSI